MFSLGKFKQEIFNVFVQSRRVIEYIASKSKFWLLWQFTSFLRPLYIIFVGLNENKQQNKLRISPITDCIHPHCWNCQVDTQLYHPQIIWLKVSLMSAVQYTVLRSDTVHAEPSVPEFVFSSVRKRTEHLMKYRRHSKMEHGVEILPPWVLPQSSSWTQPTLCCVLAWWRHSIIRRQTTQNTYFPLSLYCRRAGEGMFSLLIFQSYFPYSTAFSDA